MSHKGHTGHDFPPFYLSVMILLTSTRQMLCTFGFSFICVVLLLFICVADLAHFVVLTLLCLLCCAYFVVLTLLCLLCLCLLCCACFVFLTLLVVSLCLLWCAYCVVLCYSYFVFLNCFCLLCLLCLLACFRFASLGCPLFYFKNENCTNKHKRTALFHLNHRPGFAEHHGRTKYVSGKYTYALRHTHERQSPRQFTNTKAYLH